MDVTLLKSLRVRADKPPMMKTPTAHTSRRAAALALILALVCGVGVPPLAAEATGGDPEARSAGQRTSEAAFADVDVDGEHAEKIRALAVAGITRGCDQGRYCPASTLDRAQMASLLVRALGLEPVDEGSFDDVSARSVHGGAINALAVTGVTVGCARDHYCPDGAVTRAQMATFLNRILGLKPTGEHHFSDIARNAEHGTAVLAIADAGITIGCEPARFCGDEPVTRAQTATLLYRSVDGSLANFEDFGADLEASKEMPGRVDPIPNEDEPSPSDDAPPRAPDDGADGSVTGGPGQRSGLHFTPQEVEIWRERAVSGPYRTSGDVSPNSPGGWTRISENAHEFAADPSAGRWTGPDQGDLSTCVPDGADAPPTSGPSRLRDAAFYTLVTQDTRYLDVAKDELLWQTQHPGTDLSDSDRWCEGVLYDLGPSWAIANWATKLLFAYDYLGDDAFTTEERRSLDAWFSEAAEFFQTDLDDKLGDNFQGRLAGDYELSGYRRDSPNCDSVNYAGGPENCSVHRYYNNRRATTARFIGLVGIHQQDPSLQSTAERFVREFVAYSVFPDGSLGDFERWEDRLPDLGWAYGIQALGPVVDIADAFARTGDTSLYDYETSNGAHGSEGGSKSLDFAVKSMGRYLDGTYERYATEDPNEVGDANRIDGEHGDWQSVHDASLTVANVYYRDEYIHGMYTRTGEGMPSYPEDPASIGSHPVWTGWGGVFPGTLFMFGQMEGRVWPYGG